MSGCLVFLVPGFFGFTSIGALNYFRGVSATLSDALAQRGCDARIIECATQPTGSIRRRATRLLDTVIESGGLDAKSIHFVGHSTGGLDIRLMVTPGVMLRADTRGEDIAGKTKSVITVATPHYGTPVANFFTSLPGRQMLELLTLLATTTGGRYALFTAAQALRVMAGLDDWIGRDSTFLDWMSRRVLDRFTLAPDDPVYRFLREVSVDQGAVVQLTPEAMHIYNAAVTPRPGVRYGSVVTAAPPPPLNYKPAELMSLPRAALAGAFAVLHTITSREHRHYPYDEVEGDIERLQRLCEVDLTSRTNDGIVPTLSQPYGDILSVVTADHLDVVGQYATDDPHNDWLPSGSNFDDERFWRIWDRVAEEIAATES